MKKSTETDRIKRIEIRLSNTTDQNKEDNYYLFKILSQLKNLKLKGPETLVSNQNGDLLPKTEITKVPLNYPQISFETNLKEEKSFWQAEDLTFGFNLSQVKERPTAKTNNKLKTLTLEQLLGKVKNKLLKINHAGVNFGPKILLKQDYLEFKKRIAQLSNLYNYPTGEEWPFIIPSTDEEFIHDIDNISLERNPKFEIVFSHYHSKPLIQFDIETNMNKNEVFKLFPYPYGISLEGLINIFRTVFVPVDWGKTLLRFDFRFKSKTHRRDFGYWMIKKGGRIK